MLLTDDGRVVLTDFGIARMETDTTMTRTGLVGTPAFIAPERLRGYPAQRQSDLWSLGAMLYAAVEGRPPHDKGMAMATMHAVLNDEPEPALRAGRLGAVLSGLLDKNPDVRLSADQAERMLRSIAEDRSAVPTTSQRTMPPTPLPMPATSPPRKSRKEPRQPAEGGRSEAAAPSSSPSAPPEAAPAAEAGARGGAEALRKVQSLKRAPAPRDGSAPEQAAEPEKAPAGRAEAPPAAERPPAQAGPAADIGPAADAGPATRVEPAVDAERAMSAEAAFGRAAAAPVQPVKAPVQPVKPPVVRASAFEADAQRPARVPRQARGAEPQTRKRPYGGMPPAAAAETALAAETGATSMAPPIIPMSPGDDLTGDPDHRPLPILRIALVAIPAILIVAGIALWLGAQQASDTSQGRGPASSRNASPEETDSSGASPAPSDAASSPPASSSGKSPSATPKPATSSAADVPDGWRRFKHSSGFSIAVPKGWRKAEENSTQVYFRSNDSHSYLMIDRTSSPRSDAKATWVEAVPSMRGNFPGYKLVAIRKVKGYWKTAADWEFTFGDSRYRSHAIDRGFVTDKKHGYALFYKTQHKGWKKKKKEYFDTFASTFRPAK